MAAVRMSDIAKRLGISTVTVSKALSGKDGVGEDLRAHIIKTSHQMGYRKRSNTTKGTYTIGIVLAKRLQVPEHSFYWALNLKLIDTLKKYNYYNMVEIIDEEQEQSLKLPEFVENGLVSGIIVIGYMQKNYLAALQTSNIPLVLLDYEEPDLPIPAVIPDNFYGAYEMTNVLLEKGHTRVGFLGSPSKSNNAVDRFYGYCKAIRKYNVPLHTDWVVDNRDDLGLLIHNFKLPLQIPTAFFCDTDQSAFYFLQFLKKQGYRVPEDISLVGYYDHVFATLTVPNFTTYHIDTDIMTKKAIDILLGQIEKETEPPARIIIAGYVVERQSVSDLRKKL